MVIVIKTLRIIWMYVGKIEGSNLPISLNKKTTQIPDLNLLGLRYFKIIQYKHNKCFKNR